MEIEVDANISPAPPEIAQPVTGTGSMELLDVFKNSRPMMMGIFEHSRVRLNGDVVVIEVDNLIYRNLWMIRRLKKNSRRWLAGPLAATCAYWSSFMIKKKNDGNQNKIKTKELNESLRKKMVETPIIERAMEIFDGEVIDLKISRKTER